MNFFLLCLVHANNAALHCDKHVVKMILELTQMLWTAVHASGFNIKSIEHLRPYRKTHTFHPTAVWVRETPKNWAYTLRFAVELCREYTKRYGRTHKCLQHLRHLKMLGYLPPTLKNEIKSVRAPLPNGCTDFPLAMPEDCIVTNKLGVADAVLSHRHYKEMKNEEWKRKRKRGMQFTAAPKRKRKRVCLVEQYMLD